MYINEDAFFKKRSELLQLVQIEAPNLTCFTEILHKRTVPIRLKYQHYKQKDMTTLREEMPKCN